MSDVLTRRDDFCPVSAPPSKWSRQQLRSQQHLKLRPLESPSAFSAPTSPVTTYPDKSIWERLDKFDTALSEAIELSETMVSEDEASPIDIQTFIYAVTALTPLFIEMEMPAPLVLPLQNGGIGAEWHEFEMNIELRFRNPYHVYAVLEDARGTIPTFHGRDPYLTKTREALREFATRVG